MCHPAWGRARIEAQRLGDLARPGGVRDRTGLEHAQPLNAEALAREGSAAGCGEAGDAARQAAGGLAAARRPAAV